MTRPHLLSGGGGNTSHNDPSPLQSLQSLNRFLSPTQQAPASPTSPSVPKTQEELLKEAKQREEEAKRIEMVSKLAQKGIKSGTAGARSSISMISRNKTAMGALDKNGLGNLIRGADSIMGKKPQAPNGAASPPPSTNGAAGLMSSKVGDQLYPFVGADAQTFGHVDTASKMGAFTSMWKDPQKGKSQS